MAGERRKRGDGDPEGPPSTSEPRNPHRPSFVSAPDAASPDATIFYLSHPFHPGSTPSFQPPPLAPLGPLSHFELADLHSFQMQSCGLPRNSFDNSMSQLSENATSHRDGASRMPQPYPLEMSGIGFPTLATGRSTPTTTDTAAFGQEFPVRAGQYMSCHVNPVRCQMLDGSSPTSTSNMPAGFSEFHNTTSGFSGVMRNADAWLTWRNMVPQPNTSAGQGWSLNTGSYMASRFSNTQNGDCGSSQMQRVGGFSRQVRNTGRFSGPSQNDGGSFIQSPSIGGWPFSDPRARVTGGTSLVPIGGGQAGRQEFRMQRMASFPTSNSTPRASNLDLELSLSVGDKRTPLKQEQTGSLSGSSVHTNTGGLDNLLERTCQALTIGNESGPDQVTSSHSGTSSKRRRPPSAADRVERKSKEYRPTSAESCKRDRKTETGTASASRSLVHTAASSSFFQTACHLAASLSGPLSTSTQTPPHQTLAPAGFRARFSPHQASITSNDQSTSPYSVWAASISGASCSSSVSVPIQTNSLPPSTQVSRLPSARSSQVPQRAQTVTVQYIKRQGRPRAVKESGYRCRLCKRDLSYAAEGAYVQPEQPPEVAVLACGHSFHSVCLERITPEEQVRDPPCIPCAISED